MWAGCGDGGARVADHLEAELVEDTRGLERFLLSDGIVSSIARPRPQLLHHSAQIREQQSMEVHKSIVECRDRCFGASVPFLSRLSRIMLKIMIRFGAVKM